MAGVKSLRPLRTTVNRRLLPDDPLEAITVFEQGKSPVHKTLNRVVKRLKKAGIPYVVVGGMAIDAHGHHRLTNDVDLLLTPTGLSNFRRLFVPKNYLPTPGRDRRFVDRVNKITLDILVTGGTPGWGQPTPVRFPDPEQVGVTMGSTQYLDLRNLIELKLAARRYQDFADVVKLIAIHNLDEAFQGQLHASVHSDYLECLEEKRREDVYDAQG
jgi:hypothetical protein